MDNIGQEGTWMCVSVTVWAKKGAQEAVKVRKNAWGYSS